MTQDERRMLEDLANKIAQTPPPPKDAEAEDLIRRRIGSRPDALYLMTQTVLIQNLALQQAQQQLQSLQRSGSAGAGSSGSFIGQQGGYGGQSSAPPPPPPQYAPPSPQAPSPQAAAPSGSPSFLKGAAQTAAGVAAGALAFEGIRSLFSHPGYGGGAGFFGGGGGFGGPVEETVVNNYYDNPTPGIGDHERSFLGGGDDQGYANSSDLGPADDTNYDDSGSDFDDGGGFDDNSGGDNFA